MREGAQRETKTEREGETQECIKKEGFFQTKAVYPGLFIFHQNCSF